jgi:hypothetical protein
VDGRVADVNSRLRYLVADRTWAAGRGSDEGDGLGRALEAAGGVVGSGGQAALADQVAGQVFDVVQAAESGVQGWQVSVGMRDSAVALMERHLAGSAMLPAPAVGSGGDLHDVVWPADLPDDFLSVRAEVERELAGALRDSGLTASEQWQSVNYIAYKLAAAPEPYKSLYLADLPKVDPVHTVDDPDTPGSQTNYYNGGSFLWWGNSLKVDFKEAFQDPRGQFFVLFHELGHGIDDVEDPFGVETAGYSDGGVTLNDAITADVRANLTQTIIQFSDDKAQRARVVDAIMNKTTGQLTGTDVDVLANLRQDYWKKLYDDEDNVVSDIYGAATGNVIIGRYTHGGAGDSSYWDARPNGAASEFWAGFAGNNVMGGQGFAATEAYLPSATVLADRMAQEMAK